MVTGDRSRQRIPLEQALPLTVGDVMIARPKTLPSDITVGEVRHAFAQSSQRVVLLVDGATFSGAIDRDAVDPHAPDSASAVVFASRDVASVTPATPLPEAVELLDRNREPRLVVLDEDGHTLRGLLCFNQSSASFCVR
ncbi:MAG: CBS domain-containing protein [Solirubrobacteraceae bacterium]